MARELKRIAKLGVGLFADLYSDGTVRLIRTNGKHPTQGGATRWKQRTSIDALDQAIAELKGKSQPSKSAKATTPKPKPSPKPSEQQHDQPE